MWIKKDMFSKKIDHVIRMSQPILQSMIKIMARVREGYINMKDKLHSDNKQVVHRVVGTIRIC